MKYKAIILGLIIGILIAIGFGTYAQISGLWKYQSSLLQPIISTWPIYSPDDLIFLDEIKPDNALCGNDEFLSKTGADDWDCVTIADADVPDTITIDQATNALNLENIDWGTMTDTKVCVYDLANTEVDCNTAVGVGDITDVGDCSTGACFTADGTGNTLYFEGSSADAYETILTSADITTADKTFTFPDDEIADNDAIVGTGAGTFGYTAIPDCDDPSHLNYDTTAGTFSCGTTDDDIPEVGDFDAFSGGRSLTYDTSGNTLNADTELYTDVKCVYWEDPVAGDDFKSVWTANGFAATITKMWCESDQTVNMDLQVDDGTPADVNGTDLVCDATPAEDESMGGDATLADGDRLDFAVTSVSGTPTWCSMCWTYTTDD